MAALIRSAVADYLSEENESGETKYSQIVKKAINREYTQADLDVLIKIVKLLEDKDGTEARNLVLQIEQGSAQSIAEFISKCNGNK